MNNHKKISIIFVLCAVLCLVTQSRPTPCDPMDYSPPGYSRQGLGISDQHLTPPMGILCSIAAHWVMLPIAYSETNNFPSPPKT